MQLLKRILDFRVDAAVPKSSAYSILSATAYTVIEAVGLGRYEAPSLPLAKELEILTM
jgi:hypothetical protein